MGAQSRPWTGPPPDPTFPRRQAESLCVAPGSALLAPFYVCLHTQAAQMSQKAIGNGESEDKMEKIRRREGVRIKGLGQNCNKEESVRRCI